MSHWPRCPNRWRVRARKRSKPRWKSCASLREKYSRRDSLFAGKPSVIVKWRAARAGRLQSQACSVILRQRVPFFFRKQGRDCPHRFIHIIGALPFGECLQLVQKIIGILRRERRRANFKGDGAVTRLAGRNAALAIAEGDEARSHFLMRGSGWRLRKDAVVLRIGKDRQRRIIGGKIGDVAQGKRLRNRHHYERPPLPGAEVLELLPDRKFIHAGQVGRKGDRTETLRAMAVLATAGEQHAAETISA